jgi:cell division protein FtsW (lipid II flippase)
VSPGRYVATPAEVQTDRNVCSHGEQSLSVFHLCASLVLMLAIHAEGFSSKAHSVENMYKYDCVYVCMCVCVYVCHTKLKLEHMLSHVALNALCVCVCVCVQTCIYGVCVCTTGGWWLVVNG